MILAGDVGGTNTRLALFRANQDACLCLKHEAYLCSKYDSLVQIIHEFCAGLDKQPDQACIGVAGVVIKGRCDATNLPWVLDESELASACNFSTVKLINDLEAAAYGVITLDSEYLVDINPYANQQQQGNQAVIAAGTGLGEAVLYFDGNRYHPFATEGGHCDFAPADDKQYELLLWMRERWGAHVSYERIVSGPGLVDIYRWLIDTAQFPELLETQAAVQLQDFAAVISLQAQQKQDPACQQALTLFVQIYAQEAGNLALKSLARGGVYLAGGIAPKILPVLQTDEFLRNWLNKGRFSSLLKSIPVRVVTHPQVALIGAANCLNRA
ncbi:MAG: glucokinase [Gammaproteobacteria bacterium]|nr:glucokinase [Gammaproteobacteria bacterium]